MRSETSPSSPYEGQWRRNLRQQQVDAEEGLDFQQSEFEFERSQRPEWFDRSERLVGLIQQGPGNLRRRRGRNGGEAVPCRSSLIAAGARKRDADDEPMRLVIQ